MRTWYSKKALGKHCSPTHRPTEATFASAFEGTSSAEQINMLAGRSVNES
jgi:hypothetical protein